jgi:hypothetical protein
VWLQLCFWYAEEPFGSCAACYGAAPTVDGSSGLQTQSLVSSVSLWLESSSPGCQQQRLSLHYSNDDSVSECIRYADIVSVCWNCTDMPTMC